MDSKTKSLEKNPLNIGRPKRLAKQEFITIQEKGVNKTPDPKWRISWVWKLKCIISPIHINNKDLKRAWASMCNNDKFKNPQEKAKPIKPKCLKVDKAISFFISTSNKELRPA